MILLLLAASLSHQIDAAYTAGRCSPWMTTFAKEQTLTMLDEADPRLRSVFNEGVSDSNKEPLRFEVCEKMIRDVNND